MARYHSDQGCTYARAYVVPSNDQGRSRWAASTQPIRYELCQAMRDVLIGCDLQATISQRAEEAFDNLRQDFTWIEPGSTALVRKRFRGQRRPWTSKRPSARSATAVAAMPAMEGQSVPPLDVESI